MNPGFLELHRLRVKDDCFPASSGFASCRAVLVYDMVHRQHFSANVHFQYPNGWCAGDPARAAG